MRDYEIRYLHANGSLSLLYKTACQSDEDAYHVARQMLPDNCSGYEIWRDSVRLDDAAGQQAA